VKHNSAVILTILRAYPKAIRWVRDTIEEHRPRSIGLNPADLPRLFQSVDHEILEATRLVCVEHMPRPPLEAWNLHALDDFAFMNAAGLTLDNFVFVRPGLETDASLMFHELVHVAQWRALGRARFLALYGVSLLRRGYDANPLEVMAHDLQARFDRGDVDFNFEAIVQRRTQEFAAQFRRENRQNRIVDIVARLFSAA